MQLEPGWSLEGKVVSFCSETTIRWAKTTLDLWQTAHTVFWGEWGSAALLESDQLRPACLSSCIKFNTGNGHWWHERRAVDEDEEEYIGRSSSNSKLRITHSLMTWQSVLFWSEQSHLMAGLNAGLSSSGVSSVAAPLHGLPLMFHDAGALSPSLLRIAFTAAAAKTKQKQIQGPVLRQTGYHRRAYIYVPSTGSVCGTCWACTAALQERHKSGSKNSSTAGTPPWRKLLKWGGLGFILTSPTPLWLRSLLPSQTSGGRK